MDNTTNSKMIRYQKRKDDTVVIVSGGKTWYTHLGELPFIKDGIPSKDTIGYLKEKDTKQQEEIDSMKTELKALKSTVRRLVEKMKEEKESDKL